MHTRAYVYKIRSVLFIVGPNSFMHIPSSTLLPFSNQTIFLFLPYSFRVFATSCIQPLKRSSISSASSSPCLFWLLFFLSGEGSFFKLLCFSISHACSRQLQWYVCFPSLAFYFRLFGLSRFDFFNICLGRLDGFN